MSQHGYMLYIPWNIEAPGGVNQVVVNLYDTFCSTGLYKPVLFIPSWDANTVESKNVDSRRQIRYRVRAPFEPNNFIICILKFLLALPSTLSNLSRIVNNHGIQVINAHYPNLSFITFIVLKKLQLFKGKLIISLHGTDIRNAASTKGKEYIAWQYMLNNVDAIVPCSDGLKAIMLEAFPNVRTKISVIHNGIDIDCINSELDNNWAPSIPVKQNDYIINIGSFDYVKGHDILIKSFYRIQKSYANLKLVIIGREAPELPNTVKLINSLGLANNVIILKNCSHKETMNYLNNSRLLVSASRNEAFSLVLLEAGTLGKAVIATDVCGVSELIENNINGIVVASENVNQLSAELAALLDSDSRLHKLGNKLQEKVTKNYSWIKAANGYSDI